MPKTESRVRTIASYVLLGLCLTHALLALLPMPTFGLWTARLVAKELTLVAAVLAVAGMVLARSHWVRGLSFTALIWAVRPTLPWGGPFGPFIRTTRAIRVVGS